MCEGGCGGVKAEMEEEGWLYLHFVQFVGTSLDGSLHK